MSSTSASPARWSARAALRSPFLPQGVVEDLSLATSKDGAERERTERNFRLAAHELKRMAFEDLRDALEGRQPRRAHRKEGPGPASSTSSPDYPPWDAPFLYLELEYPLNENVRYAPPEQVGDDVEALWWLSSALNEEWGTKSRLVTALQIMTRSAAFVRRNGEVNPVIPLVFFDSFRAMSEEQKAAFLRQWFSPVSHGDPCIEKDGKVLPTLDASLSATDGTRSFRAAAVFEVYPLMVDLDAERAYFTLKVGLPWQGDMGSPVNWTSAERETLWSALFSSLSLLAAYYKGLELELPAHVEAFSDEAEAVWIKPETVTLSGVTLEAKGGTVSAYAEDRVEVTDRIVSEAEATATIRPMTELVGQRGGGDEGRGDGRVFPLAFGNAYADASAVDFVQNIHKLRLPRSWAKLKRFSELAQEEIREALESRDQSKLELVPEAGKPRSEWSYKLTKEAERKLREREGAKGFIDFDRSGRESIYRSVADNKGHLLEVWLSWDRLAAPFFPDRVEAAKKEALAQLGDGDPKTPSLFAELDDELKRKVERQIRRLNLYEHGRAVMEMLLGQVGRQRHNPVEVPAEAFRTLLWPSGDVPDDWKETVKRTLDALMSLTSVWRAGSITGTASFIGSWEYRPLGRGGHGEGIYVVGVTDQFVRSLKFFEAGGTALRSGVEALVYDFNKLLPREERKGLNFVSFDAGRTFYHAAAGLSATQRNLAHWIERELTRNRDAVPHGRAQIKVTKGAEASEPRRYDHTFCPLLPEGQSFVAALGHFKRNPEAGWTLYGTAKKGGGTGGQHVDGLVAVVGHPLPPGRAHVARADAVAKTLEDLKAVVVEYLGGMIVGKLTERQRKDGQQGVQWLRLEEFEKLDEDTYCRSLKLFLFLPHDWNERRREAFEKKTGYRTTESVAEAEAAAWSGPEPELEAGPPRAPERARKARGEQEVVEHAAAPGTILKGAEDGWRGFGPLPNRLHAALKEKNMERQELARVFGVTKALVSQWLYGMKLGQNPAKAKRIPPDLGALMVRWLETGQEPTKEELAALPSRRNNPALRGRKQDVDGRSG